MRTRCLKDLLFLILCGLILSGAGIVRLSRSSGELARARAEARAAGIPLTPAEFPLPKVPPSENAAPDYEKLGPMFRSLGVNQIPAPNGKPTPAQLQEMGHLFAKRPDITAQIHRTLAKPHFSLPMKFELSDRYPDFQTARNTAGWIAWRGWREAEAGQPEKGVQTIASGFRIAEHHRQHPHSVSLLVSSEAANTTLDQLDQMLRTYGADPAVLNAVTRALDAHDAAPDLEQFLTVCFLRGMRMYTLPTRQLQLYYAVVAPTGPTAAYYGPRSWPRLRWLWSDIAQARAGVMSVTRALVIGSAPPSLFRHSIQEPSTADYIDRMRDVVMAGREAEPLRTEHFRHRSTPGARDRDGALSSWDHLATIFGSGGVDLSRLNTDLNEPQARRNVLLAAAGVMAFRNRTGKWPNRLSEAIPNAPRDPFDPIKRVRYRRIGAGFSLEAGTARCWADEYGLLRTENGAVFCYPNPYAVLPPHLRAGAMKKRFPTGPVLKPIRRWK